VTELEIALQELTQKEFPVEVVQELKSGKEAKVFIVEAAADQKLYALKVYHNFLTRAFGTQKHYLEDRYIGSENSSSRRAVQKGNLYGRTLMQSTWVMREQYFLKKIGDQTEYMPKMIKGLSNGVLMEFIGDETGPAPRLSEVKLPEERIEEVVTICLDLIELFLQNGIVHGDFSPFNILWWNNKPYVIDFPQAVDIRESKRVYSLLKRDIRNIMHPYNYDDELVEELTVEMLERNGMPVIDG